MRSSNPSPEAVPPADVARMLSVSLATVKRMLADGRLPSLKLGRARRIPVEAVRDLIRQCQAGRG
jgi:excisionase family DNA binding protein